MKFILAGLLLIISLSSNAKITYDSIKCLSNSQLKSLETKMDLKMTLDGNGDCRSNDPKSKFLKALSLIEHFKTSNVPASLDNELSSKLKNFLASPFEGFLGRTNNFFHNKGMVSRVHKPRGLKQLQFGNRFFNLSPLEAALEMVSFSLDNERASYAKCLRGEFRGIKACEHNFETKDFAGPFSTKVLLSLALAHGTNKLSDLVSADRLIQIAKRQFYTGLNRYKDYQGLIIERMIFLGRDRKLYQMLPFTKKLVLVDIDYSKFKEIKKIKHNRKTGGLFIFFGEGEIAELSADLKLRVLNFPLMNGQRIKVKDYTPVTTFNFDDDLLKASHYNVDFVLDENSRAFILFDGHENGESGYYTPNDQLRMPTKSLTSCWHHAVCILDENGKRWSWYRAFTNLRPYKTYQNDQRVPWRHIDGGYTEYEVYGINDNGVLYQRDGAAIDPFEKHDFQTGTVDTFKFVETSSFFSLADRSAFYTQRDDSIFDDEMKKISLSEISPIRDYDKVSDFYIASFMNPFKLNTQDFRNRCEVVSTTYHPWLHSFFGVKRNGDVVVDLNGKCLETNMKQKENERLVLFGISKRNFWGEVALKFKNIHDNSKSRYYPVYQNDLGDGWIDRYGSTR
ncbi:MAG: hypothetical protein ACPGJV_11455 [Bacteriovoracaceae bacterium]